MEINPSLQGACKTTNVTAHLLAAPKPPLKTRQRGASGPTVELRCPSGVSPQLFASPACLSPHQALYFLLMQPKLVSEHHRLKHMSWHLVVWWDSTVKPKKTSPLALQDSTSERNHSSAEEKPIHFGVCRKKTLQFWLLDANTSSDNSVGQQRGGHRAPQRWPTALWDLPQLQAFPPGLLQLEPQQI